MNEELPKIYYSVRKGLSHCTSIEGLKKIHETEVILPSGSSQMQYWNRTFAAHTSAVSLFDFESAPEEKALEQACKWIEMFLHHKPTTVVIGLNRGRLAANLKRNYYLEPGGSDAAFKRGDFKRGNFIPYVESLHKGPILLDAITKYIAVCAADISVFESIEADENVFTELERILEKHRKIAAEIENNNPLIRILNSGRSGAGPKADIATRKSMT